jgi:hypothetical protein
MPFFKSSYVTAAVARWFCPARLRNDLKWYQSTGFSFQNCPKEFIFNFIPSRSHRIIFIDRVEKATNSIVADMEKGYISEMLMTSYKLKWYSMNNGLAPLLIVLLAPQGFPYKYVKFYTNLE